MEALLINVIDSHLIQFHQVQGGPRNWIEAVVTIT